MDDLNPSDLKTILHSKRANIYYLQHCRVLVNGGRVEYVTDQGELPRDQAASAWQYPQAALIGVLPQQPFREQSLRETTLAWLYTVTLAGAGTRVWGSPGTTAEFNARDQPGQCHNR